MAKALHCSNSTLVKTVTVTEDFISATRSGIQRRQAELKAQISGKFVVFIFTFFAFELAKMYLKSYVTEHNAKCNFLLLQKY